MHTDEKDLLCTAREFDMRETSAPEAREPPRERSWGGGEGGYVIRYQWVKRFIRVEGTLTEYVR